jgi:DNA-binding response OmpR family regulator
MYKGRLLVLEDDPHVAKVIGIIAESCRLETRILTESRGFFATLDAWQPSQVALDLGLPGVDGEQILAELARRESGERIVIMSGSSGRVLDAAGASAAQRGLNIIGLLAKPFATAALRAMLSERAPAARELAPGLIQPVLKEPVLVQPVFSPASTPRLALR